MNDNCRLLRREHGVQLKLVLELLKKEKLYAKFTKSKAVKNLEVPTTSSEDVQAFYAKELPISSPDPITSPAILTPSPILPPSLLFDPRYFFIPEELLPPKKRIHLPISSLLQLFIISEFKPVISWYHHSSQFILYPNAAEIRETDDFKEYETVFMKTAGVSSSPRKIIKQKKQSTPSIPPPGDDRERDAIAEATLLSLTLHKTALLAEAQENIAKVQEKLDDEEIDKMVEGGADKAKIARKRLKPGKNEHGNGRARKEPGKSY
ncbi:hypothetical protein Tco_0902793 [Tanacetum coccineum]